MWLASKTILLDDTRVVSFRAVEAGDSPFLLEVYGSTRADELALTDWDASRRNAFLRMQLEAQQAHYEANYPSGEHLVILLNGQAVGRIWVADDKLSDPDRQMQILDMTMLPEHRDKGIGTPIIKELIAESSASGVPLTIYVESFNRSLGLFERLGFKRAGQSGYSYLLKYEE